MPIAALSATQDIFAKLGPLVKAVNKMDGLENDYTVLSGTGVGDMQTEFDDAITILQPTTRPDDNVARQTLTRAYDGHRNIVRSWKQLAVSNDRLILAAKMVEAESLHSDAESVLLTRLVEVMDRSGMVAKVQENDVDIPTPSADAGNTGNATAVSSKYASTVQGADASSQINGKLKTNYYRIECVDNSVEHGEIWAIRGNIPKGGVSTPYWENVGEASNTRSISSVGQTMLSNGGFETLNAGSTAFSQWSSVVGTWSAGGTLYYGTSSNAYLGSRSLMLKVNSATTPQVRQTLAENSLLPNSKYLFTCKAKLGTASATGSLKVGFTGTSGLFDVINTSALTTSAFRTFSHIFNTGDDPSEIVDVNVLTEYTSGATCPIYVDEVTLSVMPIVGNAGIAVIAGDTPSAVGDFFTSSATNDKAGIFATHFARWHDTLLPASATPNVTDPS